MGNNTRSPEDYDLVCKFNQQDWIHQSNQEGLQIWRNKYTKETVQVIRLYEIPSIEDMDIYSFRMMENDLIKVYHLSIDKDYDMCATNQLSLLLVEYIPIKLINIRNFDREEALTILSATFRAFHLLQIKFGPIVPNEELIGFNQQGKTKIWLNRKSYVNYVDREITNLQQSSQILQVSQRVKRLLQIIEQKTKYMLLPPSIRQQICHPYTTYLSALKILQKFAYFEKLNLRKNLQLGFNNKINRFNSAHKRNNSHFSQNKQNNQICCQRNESSFYQSAIKQPGQLRRMYSVNSIHKSNNSSVFIPAHIPFANSIDRSNQPFFIKNSVTSNASNVQSVRPSSVNFKHCHVINISTVQGQKNNKNSTQVKKIQKVQQKFNDEPKKSSIVKDTQQQRQQQKTQAKQAKQLIEYVITQHQQQKVQQQNEQNYMQLQPINNEVQLEQQNSIKDRGLQQQYISFKQPASPTFVVNNQFQHQFRSFAPSQQNLQQLQKPDNIKKQEKLLLAHQDTLYFCQVTPPYQKQQQQRRLSIQNNNKKLEFPNQLAINSVSILNYCTSVQSKLHMATNRDHSIIDNKKSIVLSQFNKYQDDQIEQYIREKYSIKPQQKDSITNKLQKPETNIYVSTFQNVKTNYISSKPKKLHNRVSTSLNHFEGQQDFLDVNFLEKSLDKRYCNIQNQLKMEQQKKEIQQNDALNIAKLQEGLQKFSKSQLSNKNTQHNIQSKQLIQKKQFQYTGSYQYEKPNGMISTFNPLQYSTGFQSYHPFKEKNFNEERYYNPHANEQSFDYQSKYQKKTVNQEKYNKKEYENNYQPNKHQYSFEGNSRSSYSPQNSNKPINRSYYIKETQLSSIEQIKTNKHDYPQTNSFDAKQPKTTHRGISYQQLRQFLWN